MLPIAEDTLATDADQRKGVAPRRVTLLAEFNGDGGVAVVVADDGPFEAEVVKCRMLDGEATGVDGVLG